MRTRVLMGLAVAVVVGTLATWLFRPRPQGSYLPPSAYSAAPEPPPFDTPVYEIPEDNAWDYYLAAFELLPGASDLRYDIERGDTPPLAEVEAAVAAGLPALDKTREGLGKRCVIPAQEEWDYESLALMAHPARCRGLTRLFCWEGWAHRERGDAAEALNSYWDALRFGQDVARNQGTIYALTSHACQDLALRGIRDTLSSDALSEDALATLVGRLAVAQEGITPWRETVLAEHRDQVLILEWMRRTAREDPEGIPELCEEYGLDDLETGLAQGRAALDALTRQVIEVVEQPLWEWHLEDIEAPAEGTFARDYVLYPPPGDNVKAHVGGLVAKVQGTLLVAALELHHARKGAYPDTLDALVPTELAELPVDPWTGKPFCYTRDGAAYRLYSVGQDRQDDGGDPEKDRTFHFAQ